jgi:hypothetical protein
MTENAALSTQIAPDATEVRIYSDEVGPTGLDLLNSDQPFFIASYIIADESLERELDSRIRFLLAAEGMKAPKELKFSKLGGSAVGMRHVINVMGVLNELEARVHICIIEKRFQACALVVETFLDATTHPDSPPQYELREWRQWLANVLYDSISDDLLQLFLTGIKQNQPDRIRDAGGRMAERLRLHPQEQVRRTATALRQGLSEFFDFNAGGPLPTATITGFLPTLLTLDSALASLGVIGTLVCDKDLQSGPAMEQVLKRARDPDYFETIIREFAGPSGQPASRVLARTELDSVSSLQIQAADLVAGLFNRVCIARLRGGTKLESKLSRAWSNLHPCIVRGLQHHFGMVSAVVQNRNLFWPG